MKKPDNVQIYEHDLATYWIDNDGILNVNTKPVTRTRQNTESLIQGFKKLLGGQKVFLLSDLTFTKELTDEARAYYKTEFSSLFKATAYFATSEFGRMIGTMMYLVFNPFIPTKIFSNEEEARGWLKELKTQGESILPEEVARKKVKGKLLVVDDNPGEEGIIKFALEESHWNVCMEFFTESEMALEYLRQTKDDIFLIVSDINMPGMNGFEFKKVIDADKYLAKKGIPFIYITSSISKNDIAKAYDNKVQGYFQKPADIKEATTMFDQIFKYWLISRHPYKEW